MMCENPDGGLELGVFGHHTSEKVLLCTVALPSLSTTISVIVKSVGKGGLTGC